MTTRNILISNGFDRFHLAVAAAELERRSRLAMMLTGAYPSQGMRQLIKFLGLTNHPRTKRLIDRAENIPTERVTPLAVPELAYNFRQFIPVLHDMSYRLYGHAAASFVRQAHVQGARIFHYRAGFGHASVREAKRLGMATLCDHSIAHPSVLQGLIEFGGRLPPTESCRPADLVWTSILEDIEHADHVLVNSDFVGSTFLHMGWPAEKISTIYLGVDQKFFDQIPQRASSSRYGPLRILFAGSFGRRKGADIVLQGLMRLSGDWELNVAGAVEDKAAIDALPKNLRKRINLLGTLHRSKLPGVMSDSDIFLFPSLAEGSARVVFEALACGLPVITTPNSGSIVEHGKHGWLIPPGDPASLADAITEAQTHREKLQLIGRRNAELIRSSYTQTTYGHNLLALYDRLFTQMPATQTPTP